MSKLETTDDRLVIDFASLYTPHPKQMEAHAAPERYILAGGAKGGGKSQWVCAEPIQLCLDFPKNRGYLCRHENAVFRKTTLLTLQEIMPWDAVARHDKQDQLFEFINGSQLYYGGLRPTQSEKPLDRIKSMNLGFFAIDEASETERRFFLMLCGGLRIGHVPPSAYKGLITSNPEPGWVKADFIDVPIPNSVFVQMLPTDNPHLPPDYVDNMRLAFAGNPGWVERYIEGDWNAPMIMGGAFYVFNWPMIQGAIRRELPQRRPTEIGIDVARGGADMTQIYIRRGAVVEHVLESTNDDTMTTVELARASIDQLRPSVVRVDAVGVGAGVADRLSEMYEEDEKVEVVAFIGGATANNSERFFNARAEAYWEVRERAERGELDLSEDPELSGQMASIRYRIRSDKRIQIESKEEMRKRGMKSPDKLDAMVLAFAGGQVGGLDVYIV